MELGENNMQVSVTFNFDEIVIATGYRSNKIEEYLVNDYPNYEFKIFNSAI